MKFAKIASLGLAASYGTMQYAEGASFDDLLSLVAQLQDEANMLATEYAQKDEEIQSLIAQLTFCEGGSTSSVEEEGSENVQSSSEEDNGGSGSGGVGVGVGVERSSSGSSGDNSEEGSSSKGVDPEPTPTPTTTSDTPPSEGGGGGFKFSVGQSWNYNLASPVDTDVDVDVFFIDMNAGQSVIDDLHAKGKGVVCYISIGTLEDWREDKDEFPTEAIGGGVSGWAGEQWLDVNNAQVRAIMSSRVQKAASMKCDAVEPDNMNVAYQGSGTGVQVTKEEQIEYNVWFADEVHGAGMAVGLKNVVEMVPDVVDKFDYALNESCHDWNECDVYSSTFLAEGKPVFNVEYDHDLRVCDEANALGLDTIIKEYDLQAPFCSCLDPSKNVDCKL